MIPTTVWCNPNSAAILKLKKNFLLLIFGKELVPLLEQRLWLEMILKDVLVPHDSAQVPSPIVHYQIG